MQDTEPEEKSRIDLKRIFTIFFNTLLALVALMVLSLLVFFILQGGEHKGFFYFIVVVLASLPVFWKYIRNIRSPPRLTQEPEPELYGNLESMATMIWRASENYEYSREKLEEKLSQLSGKECHLEGKRTRYLEALQDILEEM